MSLDAIGLIGDALGIFSFLKDNLPSGPQGATVRIHTGHQFSDDQNFGGQISTIDGYDNFNKKVGSTSGGYIGDGSFADYNVGDGLQLKYATIRNDNDATCILYTTLSNVDNQAPGAWTGDIGQACGQTWYYGNTSVGQDSNGNNVFPKCTWLDGDHSNNIVSGSMKINFQAYGEHPQDVLDKGTQCSSTAFQDNNGEVDGAPSDPSKRSTKSVHGLARKPWMKDHLIVSSIDGQTAKELCEHPMSWGSDFVGSDGYFCDMETHKLSPLCKTAKVPGCLIVDETNSKIKRTMRSPSTTQWEDVVHRSYKKVANYFK